jgi:arylformamidase
MNHKSELDLEREYDNRANVPEHPEIMAGWARDAADYRSARTGHSELGLRYGPHERQTIDLFEPDAADGGRPLIVFIHGGYWRSLEPSLFSHLAAGANARGFSIALPGYRLCPEVTVADIIEDIRSACLFLHRRFGLRLIACGHSAGGHLAAAMAATDWRRTAADAPPDLLRHGLGISGLFDLRPLLATSVNQSLRLDVVAAEAASPAFWPLPPGVQFEAWVGAAETSEYLRQSRLLAESWGQAGARTRFSTVAGANHFTAPAPLAQPGSTLTEALVNLCDAAPGTRLP